VNAVLVTFSEFFGQFRDSMGQPATPQSPGRQPGPIAAFQRGYAQGWVPSPGGGGRWERPSFPFIIYPVLLPGFAQSAMDFIEIWDWWPGRPGFMGLVQDVMGQIKTAVPEAGIILRLDDDSGLVRVQRGNPFTMFPPSDESDAAIVRGAANLVFSGYVV